MPRSPYPRKQLMRMWCQTSQAIVNKNVGEKTVHMNKCSLRIIQATITERLLKAVNRVRSAKCSNGDLLLTGKSELITKGIAHTHHIGPAQLLRKVRIHTAPTLYPAMPLYALERSTDEIAFELQSTKNVEYCSNIDVTVRAR